MPYVITRAHPAGERDPAATTSTKACSSTEVYLNREAGPKMITDTGLRDSTEAHLNREAGPKTFDRSMWDCWPGLLVAANRVYKGTQFWQVAFSNYKHPCQY
jgi:hypothetical protein